MALTLWRLNFQFFKFIYFLPAKFVLYLAPRWIYAKVMKPIGRGLTRINNFLARGVYHVLTSWFTRSETKPTDHIQAPPPRLESKGVFPCQICRMETPHLIERVSATSFDTLQTCDRCGMRQAGRWHDAPELLGQVA